MSDSSLVSIIIVTYNSQDEIVECINSVLQQDYQNIEVIIVDNASTDNTIEAINANFYNNMKVRVVRNPENNGYSGGNNLGYTYAGGEFVVILNPDAIVDRKWLTEMIRLYRQKEDAGIICSNVLLYDKRDSINACGNDLHLTGLVFSRFYKEKECRCKEEKVAAPSGASMIFSRNNLEKIGRTKPFDNQRFVMEYSDTDLALDFLGHDLSCYVLPSSKVFHKFRFKMNANRLHTLERGRYCLLCKHLTKRTLLKLSPALILSEIIVWTFSFRDLEMFKAKLRASGLWIYYYLTVHTRGNSYHKDKQIMNMMVPYINIYTELEKNPGSLRISGGIAHRVANKIFSVIKTHIL